MSDQFRFRAFWTEKRARVPVTGTPISTENPSIFVTPQRREIKKLRFISFQLRPDLKKRIVEIVCQRHQLLIGIFKFLALFRECDENRDRFLGPFPFGSFTPIRPAS
jgi:hypothetical protein